MKLFSEYASRPYNAKLLNALLSKLQNEGNEKLIEMLKYISPVAWININLYGYYTFEGDGEQQLSFYLELN